MVGQPVRTFSEIRERSFGRADITWNAFEEILLDIEIALNNRPLTYVEDDVQLPVLTPNAIMLSQPNLLPGEDVHCFGNVDLRKRAKYSTAQK